MSTKPKAKPKAKSNKVVIPPMPLKELGKILVKHYGLQEGKYEVLVEFMIGMGSVGPDKDNRYPGATIGLTKVGLQKTDIDGPNTIDATEVK